MNTVAVIDYLVQWSTDYLQTSKQQGWVLGVSGGIDSAVVSTLAAKTGKPVLLLEMPIHQAQDQVTRAQDHIQWLQKQYNHVNTLRVDLTHTFDAMVSAMPHDPEDPERALALANTRSRLRMTTLYFYAGLHRYLVMGTGNKIEDFGIGFFTKYGDGGVDLSPIGDLLKSEVYQLAKELNIIPSIQNAQPTDGLFDDNRTDEDAIGASYDELEEIMKFIEQGIPENLSTRQQEVLELYKRLNKATQHKINPIPVAKIPDSLRHKH
ncbi:MAG: NAD(+) synthase [Weeksellaceae bacterium]|nr:NAD(+) synthase [Weeksellaceae bacterium]